MKKNPEALSLCDEFIKTDAGFYKIKALAAIKLGDKDAELKTVRGWVSATHSAEAFEEAATSMLKHGRPNEVITLCKQWDTLYPKAQKLYWARAHALFLIGQDESDVATAIADFGQVIAVCKAGLAPGIEKDDATSRDLVSLMAKAQRNINKLETTH